MKSTAVDESLSSMNQQFCFGENQLLQIIEDVFCWREPESSFPKAAEKTSSCSSMLDTLDMTIVCTVPSRLFEWPRLYSELQELVNKCQVCMKYSNNNQNESTSQKLGQENTTVLFHFTNSTYLMVTINIVLLARQDDYKACQKLHGELSYLN